MTELTVNNVVQAVEGIEANQSIMNQACVAAFSGRNVKAPADSILHKALVALIKKRDAFNKAHKAANDTIRENAKLNGMKPTGLTKYQGLNILATEVTRWANKAQSNKKYQGLRASIKATGGKSKVGIALVQSAKAAPTSSTGKEAKETGDKSLNDLSCDDALKYLVDSFSFDVVSAALLKLK